MIYAPPFVFCPEGDPALGGSPLRLILRHPYPSILPIIPSVQHPLYQSSREEKKRSYLEPLGDNYRLS